MVITLPPLQVLLEKSSTSGGSHAPPCGTSQMHGLQECVAVGTPPKTRASSCAQAPPHASWSPATTATGPSHPPGGWSRHTLPGSQSVVKVPPVPAVELLPPLPPSAPTLLLLAGAAPEPPSPPALVNSSPPHAAAQPNA